VRGNYQFQQWLQSKPSRYSNTKRSAASASQLVSISICHDEQKFGLFWAAELIDWPRSGQKKFGRFCMFFLKGRPGEHPATPPLRPPPHEYEPPRLDAGGKYAVPFLFHNSQVTRIHTPECRGWAQRPLFYCVFGCFLATGF
jgi:hypothetical protein